MSEKDLSLTIAEYLQTKYPTIIYRFDLAADMKMTMGQAVRNKKLHPRRGHCDLFISAMRYGYGGLYIEIKDEGKSPYLKDGVTLRKNEHIQEQAAYINDLIKAGYAARFCTGYKETVHYIDKYLQEK